MKRYPLIFFILFFWSHNLFPQSAKKDFGLWTTISIDKKINKRWSAGFDQEMRLFDNASRINLFYSNLGINCKIRNFKLSFVYRFISKNQDDQYYSKRHRLYFDVAYKYKWYGIMLMYRLRVQGQVRDYYSSEDGKIIESYLRHKFDCSYKLYDFTPYVGTEFFFQMNDPGFQEGNGLFNRSRYYIGCDYAVNKKNSVGLYYLIQQDFNIKNPENDFIIGVQYGINF